MRLGIVPAGGNAFRFGGVFKELLPVASGVSALRNCVDKLYFCDKIALLTTPEKMSTHVRELKGNGKIIYILSEDALWKSIALTFAFGAERSFFVMPDTYFQPVRFMEEGNFELSVFKTNNAKKYGVINGGQVMDKYDLPGEHIAWGALSWTSAVVDHWKAKVYKDYTEAINDAMRVFGYVLSQMEYYYDFASMDDYVQWLTLR